jgi:hypothetical protein
MRSTLNALGQFKLVTAFAASSNGIPTSDFNRIIKENYLQNDILLQTNVN